MSDAGYEVLSIDDLERVPSTAGGAPVLLPLRRRLGFRPFGVNCWSADAGETVISPHFERGGQEELYVVLRGRASFTVGEETVDAPAGTLVHCPPGTFREAVAAEPGTVVLAAGATPGEAWRPAPWEDFLVAFAELRAGRVEEGRALVEQTVAGEPDAWQGHYNAACFESLAGDLDAAFAHLGKALARSRMEVLRIASEDADLEPLHTDPRWRELVE